MIRAVEFENGGQTIRGMLHEAPTRRKRVPAVLMCHGFTGHKVEAHRLFVKMSRALQEAGIASLRFDFRGSGESDGHFEAMTVSGEVSDALAAGAFLRRRRRVDAERLGILGLSLGGMVAALVLGETGRFRSAALWSAVGDGGWIASRLTPAERRSLRRRGYRDVSGHAVGAGFYDDAPRHDPVASITTSRADVLVVHGTGDQAVPPAHAQGYLRALKARPRGSGRAVSFLVRGADHTYARRDWEQRVIARSVTWFGETL